jgi:inward rectifier potassium channel
MRFWSKLHPQRSKQRTHGLLGRTPPSIRIRRQDDGRFQAEGTRFWHIYWRDPYHLMLMVPWWGFIGIVAVGYLLLNMFFACLYLIGGDHLEGARPGSFADAFFFSVQTLGSIGYGVISPKTPYANFIVTLEAITSLLVVAVVTGLSFARFSKPTARVLFSKLAVIAPHDGVPTLMFRLANERQNHIVEAQLRVYLLRNEVTREGEFFYRIHTLNLLRERTPAFSLTWTGMHPITPDSPLSGATAESLIHDHAQIVVTMSGTDDTAAYNVAIRHTYGAKQILFNCRFMDILYRSPNGDRYFDYTHFHGVEPLPAPHTQPLHPINVDAS